jgi:hypothetical protein
MTWIGTDGGKRKAQLETRSAIIFEIESRFQTCDIEVAKHLCDVSVVEPKSGSRN